MNTGQVIGELLLRLAGEDGERPRGSCAPRPTGEHAPLTAAWRQEQIRAFLARSGPATSVEICRALDASKAVINVTLHTMVRTRRLMRYGARRAYRYGLP